MGLEKMKEMPSEVANIQDLAVDGYDRHENSILANVPSGLADKGILAVRLFMYFMDQDTDNYHTGNKTYMNVEESYIMSGVYDDKHLEKVYRTWEVEVEKESKGVKWTDYITKYQVLDRREDMRIRSEALRYWTENGLASYFEQMALAKMGNIDPEKLIRMQIVADALRVGDNQNANRKMAIDILGMKMKKKTEALNLKKRGGAEIIDTTSQRAGAGFLKSEMSESTVDDDDEDDIEDLEDDDNFEFDNDEDFDSGFKLEGDNV